MSFAPLVDILPLQVLRLGEVPYRQALELQREIHREVVAGTHEQTLILCEHPPVITHGKGAKPESLLVNPNDLDIEVIESERGGDYTFHGPGQLIAYPILDLRTRKRDVNWYMRTLEETVLAILSEMQISGYQIPGRTGVFVRENDSQSSDNRPKKICSMGVRISRWCTFHGIALYLSAQRKGFVHLHPCGYSDIEVVSLEELGIPFSKSKMEEHFVRKFSETFGYSVSNSLGLFPSVSSCNG